MSSLLLKIERNESLFIQFMYVPMIEKNIWKKKGVFILQRSCGIWGNCRELGTRWCDTAAKGTLWINQINLRIVLFWGEMLRLLEKCRAIRQHTFPWRCICKFQFIGTREQFCIVAVRVWDRSSISKLFPCLASKLWWTEVFAVVNNVISQKIFTCYCTCFLSRVLQSDETDAWRDVLSIR